MTPPRQVPSDEILLTASATGGEYCCTSIFDMHTHSNGPVGVNTCSCAHARCTRAVCSAVLVGARCVEDGPWSSAPGVFVHPSLKQEIPTQIIKRPNSHGVATLLRAILVRSHAHHTPLPGADGPFGPSPTRGP